MIFQNGWFPNLLPTKTSAGSGSEFFLGAKMTKGEVDKTGDDE